jgi:hypothetical protein
MRRPVAFHTMATMKTSRFTKIGLVVVGVGIVAWIVVTLSTSSPDSLAPAVAVEEGHCPRCKRLLPKAAQASRDCPYCLLENGGKAPTDQGSQSLAAHPAVPITLFSVFGLLLGAHLYLLVRSRAKQGGVQALYYVYCAKCGRKIRYRSEQINKIAQCPICRRPIRFPEPPDVVAENSWSKLKRLLAR